jgi:hypothetical protein
VDQVEKDEGMWTIDDVAAHLKVSKNWVRERVTTGLLRAYPLPGNGRNGRRVLRFLPAEVRTFARSEALPPPTIAETPAPTPLDAKKSA